MNILRGLVVRNEEDIIEENLEYYINNGIKNVVVENYSTDNTYEILKKNVGKGILEMKRINTSFFNSKILYGALMELFEKYNPDWIVLADADEFFESPDCSVNLREAIEREDEEGFNVIELHDMEFWMTPLDPKDKHIVRKRIRYYSYFTSTLYRIYRYVKGMSIFPLYHPTYPLNYKVKISPTVFINRHYKFRNLKQAYQKIERVVPEPGNPKWGFQYLKFKKDPEFFIINPEKLNYYNEDCNWSLQRKFNGWRISLSELRDYLGYNSIDEVIEKWICGRDFRVKVEGKNKYCDLYKTDIV